MKFEQNSDIIPKSSNLYRTVLSENVLSRIEEIKMWGNLGLNQGPTGYESAALTTELLPQK